MKNKNTIVAVIILVAIVVGVFLLQKAPARAGELDGFASCLKDKGLLFYGAFTCKYCQQQKALFGRSASQLPYVECSTPDARGQTQICIDKKITTYPTWQFPDGSLELGVQSLDYLAEKSGCELPKQE